MSPIELLPQEEWYKLGNRDNLVRILDKLMDSGIREFLFTSTYPKLGGLELIELHSDCTFLLALLDGEVIGLIYYYDYDKEYNRGCLACTLRSDLRGKGYSRALVQRTLDYATSSEYLRAELAWSKAANDVSNNHPGSVAIIHDEIQIRAATPNMPSSYRMS